MFVHGVWDSALECWKKFGALPGDPGFAITRIGFNSPLAGRLSSYSPAYPLPSLLLSKADTNALGLKRNAPEVLTGIVQTIEAFRRRYNAAVSQADVVAHSMGGLVTQQLETLPEFANFKSFGVGNIHKLITIGTPHLGSPLAIQLLQDNNSCVRNLMASQGNVAFSQATVDGKIWNGAALDLQGDGTGGALSSVLNGLRQSSGPDVPTALIVGQAGPANLSGFNDSGNVVAIVLACNNALFHDPLAQVLSTEKWSTVFGNKPSDGIVPVTSQGANLDPTHLELGVVHSGGAVKLGMVGPTELDSNTGIPGKVVWLLNAPIMGGPPFYSVRRQRTW